MDELLATDPRLIGRYTMAAASRYVHIPYATVRSWVRGREYPVRDGSAQFDPLVSVPTNDGGLTFLNLIELHVLRALRKHHGVKLKSVRAALEYAEQHLGIRNLLLRQDLLTTSGDLFLERYSDLIDLSLSGQLAIRQALEDHLARIDWGDGDLPVRLYPVLPDRSGASHSIVIDPSIAFGRPIVAAKSISTAAIVRWFDAGETMDDLARDYSLSVQDIRDAIYYEQAA